MVGRGARALAVACEAHSQAVCAQVRAPSGHAFERVDACRVTPPAVPLALLVTARALIDPLPRVPRRECLDELAQSIRAEQFSKEWRPWWQEDAKLSEQPPDTAHALLLRMYTLDRHIKLKTSM